MQKLALEILVRKRDGRETEFDGRRIAKAITNAFRAEKALEAGELTQENLGDVIAGITAEVVGAARHKVPGQTISVEEIQDLVETGLMKRGHYAVARRYILYRSEHARMRTARAAQDLELEEPVASNATVRAFPLLFVLQTGSKILFDSERLASFLARLPESQSIDIDVPELVADVARNAFDGMTTEDISRVLVLTARSRIERDPAYDRLAAAFQRAILYREVLGVTQVDAVFAKTYRELFAGRIAAGVRGGRLAEVMLSFDLERLANALLPERDARFRYLGIQTIYDRYLLQVGGRRIETPQYFWMRVAMGLALAEAENARNDRAIEFYELLSNFRFTCATPTLFNAGTPHPQLSSCYVTTVQDDLGHIFKCIRDNAMLSKWAGGLGNDWTNVRATGAMIRGTGGKSQGVVPFLKVVNDAAVAVNQGGKRKGAVCAILEPWHVDFEEFLDLRKNTGDDRRRTHDMHTAAWVPDLFMQQVRESVWTLFSPDEVQDLHDLYGRAFQQQYENYERMAEAGKLKLFRRVDAMDLWCKLLTRLFETGHPWVTFKDPSNIRSPQDHVGVVHSSNLCTEILLNTSQDETAVCNLGSINLAAHVIDGKLDLDSLEQTITTAMRMLDNAIDVNHYPTPESKYSNMRHRPIGLGIMGFQDALHQLDIVYASEQAVEFADRSMEAVSYYALLASCNLASERGRYATFRESKWDRGLLPIDTINLLEEQRGEPIEVDRSASLDWQVVREAIAKNGMRNSNCLAIAPTATISTIVGVSQSIEPTYKHLYTKSNLSGEFTQVNPELVELLKERGLWNTDLLAELKYADGSLADIAGIPDDIKRNFVTAFEIEPRWLIEAAARRQKWLDQGQSLNLYVVQPSGKLLDEIYRLTWRSGLKTTYYLRSMAATQVEKSTIDLNRHGIQPRWMKSKMHRRKSG